MTYKYQKKALSNKIEVLKNEVLIGLIQFSNWKSSAQIQLNHKHYLIKKKGFWRRDLDIFEVQSQEIVAEFIFETWSNKVYINNSSSGSFLFNRKGLWNKRWIIIGENLQEIEFINTKSFWDKSGEIHSNIPNSDKSEFLLVLGVFLIFYKMREAASAASS